MTPHPTRRAALLSCLALMAAPVLAQTYPSKAITMVVPYPAGGPSDFVARQIQHDVSKALGQTLIVDNTGGAGGALGIQKVLGAGTDGHTVLLGSPMELIFTPLAFTAAKFRSSDLKMVAQLVKAPLVLLARKDLPAAQRQPGRRAHLGG